MKSIKVIIALLMTLVCIPFSNVSALENTDNNNTVDAVMDNYTDGFEIKNFTVCERGRTYGGFYG